MVLERSVRSKLPHRAEASLPSYPQKVQTPAIECEGRDVYRYRVTLATKPTFNPEMVEAVTITGVMIEAPASGA